MQKVITILEQRVEWIVIGLAVLFFGWMVYGYLAQSPVQVQISSKPLTPGAVDPHILANQTRQLEAQITHNKAIEMKVNPFAEQFLTAMAWGNQTIPQLAPDRFVQLPSTVVIPEEAPADPRLPRDPKLPQLPPKTAVAQIEKLPALPPAEMKESRVGRSTVLPQLAAGQPAPQPAQPGQPVQPVAGGVEKAWVTQKFMIPTGQFDAAFKAAKIPPEFASTYFIQVELIREEMDINGNFDPKSQTVIPPLANIEIKPVPAPAEGKLAEGDFLTWAMANTQIIIAPPFYAVAMGDPWVPPGIEEAAAAALPFDPATTTKRPEEMTDQEREAWSKYRRDEAKRKQDEKRRAVPQRPPAGGSPRRGSGPAEGGPSYAPREGEQPAGRPAPAPAARPTPRRPPVNLDLPPEMRQPFFDGVGPIGGAAEQGIGNVPAVVMPQAGVAFPNGQFEPAQWKDKDSEGWAHDDTVQPGRTYRYKVRYKIKNPVFQIINMTKPPELAEQIAIVSPDSEWSGPVSVPNVVNFYLANNALPGSTTVKFDVFRWHEGVQRKETFTVQPGDAIGRAKDGIDFSTGSTVVDVRTNGRTGLTDVVVMEADGKTVLRSALSDQNNKTYQSLKQQAGAALAEPPANGTGVTSIVR